MSDHELRAVKTWPDPSLTMGWDLSKLGLIKIWLLTEICQWLSWSRSNNGQVWLDQDLIMGWDLSKLGLIKVWSWTVKACPIYFFKTCAILFTVYPTSLERMLVKFIPLLQLMHFMQNDGATTACHSSSNKSKKVELKNKMYCGSGQKQNLVLSTRDVNNIKIVTNHLHIDAKHLNILSKYLDIKA